MKLALIGHGAMNRMVEILARQHGNEVSLVLTSSDGWRSTDELSACLAGHDAAVDFSVAAAVLKNAEACASAGVPLVEGTTGWKDHDQVRRIFEEKQVSLVYGANFSIGVHTRLRSSKRPRATSHS
jgi:4-hydroxy-tetrahydrodipicolinate reductase